MSFSWDGVSQGLLPNGSHELLEADTTLGHPLGDAFGSLHISKIQRRCVEGKCRPCRRLENGVASNPTVLTLLSLANGRGKQVVVKLLDAPTTTKTKRRRTG